MMNIRMADFSNKCLPGRLFVITLAFLIGNLMVYGKDIQKPYKLHLKITNPANMERIKEVVKVSRRELSLPSGSFFNFCVATVTGKDIKTQLIDEDQDGNWDWLTLEISVHKNASINLDVVFYRKTQSFVNDFNRSVQVFADTRLSKRSENDSPGTNIWHERRLRGFKQNISKPVYQMEGPGIENDKIAFRAFFDYRNGKDIYGKIISTPVLDRIGLKGSWHQLQEWGMDIFRVGNSLGAGGLGVFEGAKLYRAGDADTSDYTSLYQGALAASFQLKFKNWDIGTLKGNGSETIEMVKGEYYYRNDVRVSLQQNQYLACGIGNFETKNTTYKQHNNKFSSLSTYGPQAEGTRTALGVAVIFDNNSYAGFDSTGDSDEVPNTTYIKLKPNAANYHRIYFVGCWEKSNPIFSTKVGFESYLQNLADRLANPLLIQVLRSK